MRTYVGTRDASGVLQVTVERQAGQASYSLPHLMRHSPTGFECGYGGSGPADLARSILGDLYGRELVEREPGRYQAFKWAVVAHLDKNEWRLTEAEIRAWNTAYELQRAVE